MLILYGFRVIYGGWLSRLLCCTDYVTAFYPMQTAELVAGEFFEQGDKELQDLQIEPMVSGSFYMCAVNGGSFFCLK